MKHSPLTSRATGNSRFESGKFPPLRAKIPENSSYLIPLSANINLAKSDHLSIAMSNVNSLRLSPSIKSTNSSNATVYQGHREFPFGNSREFPGICHHKIPGGNSREFLHIASLIFSFFWNLHSAIYRIRAYFSNYSSIERVFDYKITFSGRRSSTTKLNN